MMVFGSKNQLVGLDIGSRTIKVAEALKKKNKWVLKKFGIVDPLIVNSAKNRQNILLGPR